MPLDPGTLTAQMTFVQRLVFFAAQRGPIKEDLQRVTLLDMRRKSYESELSIQAQHVGCPGRVGRLTNVGITEQLNDDSARDAASITNTYNYFLAAEILRAGEANPRGGALYYARAIRDWQPTYWAYKDEQINVTTKQSARSVAMENFYSRNGGAMGTAKLEPRTAVCPVCQGWIDRGTVPLRVALSHPPPYHPGCPHVWNTKPDHIAKEDCPNLWMGT